jgi:hypothetical protein
VTNSGTINGNSSGNTLIVSASGGVANTGTLEASGGGLLNVTSSLTSNSGTLEAASGGTLTVTQYLPNFSGNTLTGGTYIVNGTGAASTLKLNLNYFNAGGEIVNNAATIVLNGSNANVNFVDSNGHSVLNYNGVGLAANSTSSSSLTIEGGYNLTTPGNFANAGSVTVGNSSTLQVGSTTGNTYTQSGGSLLVNGTLKVGSTGASTATINGGTVSGTGQIQGSVVNTGGTISSVDPPSIEVLTITGDYTQGSGGILESYLGPSGYSQLQVNGTASLSGTLDVDILANSHPTNGEQYDVLTSNNPISGTFGTIDNVGFALPNGDSWSLIYSTPDEVILQFNGTVPVDSPEPTTVMLVAVSLLGFAAYGRKISRSTMLPA